MPIFNGNCNKCGDYTSTYCAGAKVKVEKGERVIYCPKCSSNKKIRRIKAK